MERVVGSLDDYGKPAWIAAMVVGFVLFWPIGLAILGYMIWSGRMGGRSCRKVGIYGGEGRMSRWGGGGGMSRRGRWHSPSSGNAAFDEYKEETLRRLEEEQEEFKGFLDRLRMAKDKAEFDQFMTDRKRNSNNDGGTPDADNPAT